MLFFSLFRMSTASLPNKDYYRPLTGVRCVAAYLVYIHHYNPFKSNLFDKSLAAFANEFDVGVTLFFVLSGFLISHRYMGMKHFSWRNFLVNRFARIYPIYFILTICTFIFSTYFLNVEGSKSIKLFFLNITFLKGFSDHLKFSGISQAWSLTVEECFYFIAPLVFLLLKKQKAFLIILPIFFVAVGMLLVFICSIANVSYFFENLEFLFSYTFFGRSIEFFSGIALALFLKNYKNNISGYKYTAIGIMVIALSILLLSLLNGDKDSSFSVPTSIFINNVILPLFGITIFYYGLLRENTIISKILGSRILVLLGKSSYIFYLIHVSFISTTTRMYLDNYFIIFALMNVLSIILFKIIEEPLNLLLRRKFRKKIVVS